MIELRACWADILTSNLNELVLFHDILHILLLLLLLDCLSLEVRDLVRYVGVPVAVSGPERQAPDEMGRCVLKRLLVLAADALARRKEVDPQE